MTLTRDAPDSAVYFATYEYCKKRFSPKSDNGTNGSQDSLSFLAVSGAGASAGLMSLIALFPIDNGQEQIAGC